MTNIQLAKPHCPGTEFLIVALVLGIRPRQVNPNLRATSVLVGSLPRPYIGYWTSNIACNALRWYKINWNKYLDRTPKYICRGQGTKIFFTNSCMQEFLIRF